MAGYKPNLAVNRAIKASEERGVSVTPAGTMRTLSPGILSAPKAGGLHMPKIKEPRASLPRRPKRKYYGE